MVTCFLFWRSAGNSAQSRCEKERVKQEAREKREKGVTHCAIDLSSLLCAIVVGDRGFVELLSLKLRSKE